MKEIINYYKLFYYDAHITPEVSFILLSSTTGELHAAVRGAQIVRNGGDSVSL